MDSNRIAHIILAVSLAVITISLVLLVGKNKSLIEDLSLRTSELENA